MKKRSIWKISVGLFALVTVIAGITVASLTTGAAAAPDLTVKFSGGSRVLRDTDANGYYEINTRDDLNAFSATVANGNTAINGELGCEIIFNENLTTGDGSFNYRETLHRWSPIGTYENPFVGNFDGHNYSVSGLYCSDNKEPAVGLFGFVGEGGTVKNVSVIDSWLRGFKYSDVEDKDFLVYHCGGAIAASNRGTIESCYANSTLSGGEEIGGIVGENYGTVKNCHNLGIVKEYGSMLYDHGGIVGVNYGTVENCYNEGDVNPEPSVYAGDGVGGIVGTNSGTVVNCYNIADMVPYNVVNLGGVVGKNTGTVERCYNTGNISTLGENNNQRIAGVVGYNNGTIKNCYNLGNMTARNFVAGVATHGEFGTNVSVVNCYNMGIIKATNGTDVSALVYLQTDKVTNCYYLKGCAIDKNGKTVAETIDGRIEEKTKTQFSSGEVAYLLQKGVSAPSGQSTVPFVWGQRLINDRQSSPAFNSEWVYGGYLCGSDSDEKAYTNKKNMVYDVKTPHSFGKDTGYCICHQGFMAATLTTDKYDVDGDNVKDEVYEIANAGQLYWFAAMVNDGNKSINAILTANIVVNANLLNSDGELSAEATYEWPLAWNMIDPFVGTFDGGGYTISGLYVKDGSFRIGFIQRLFEGGSIRNLGIVDSYFYGSRMLGAVVAENNGGLIENSYSKGNVLVENDSTVPAGGVVGYNNGGVVKNSYNMSNINGIDIVGGVVGQNEAGTVEGCYNTGSLFGTWYVGGVVGHSTGQSLVKNCYNAGSITAKNSQSGGVVGYNAESTVIGSYNTGAILQSTSKYGVKIGGVVGQNYKGTVQECYNKGSITCKNEAGGVVGYNDNGSVQECYNQGSISGVGKLGGVVGHNKSGTVTDSYNKGNITSEIGSNIGGVVGYFDGGTVSTSYNVGNLQGDDRIGGVVGQCLDGELTSCYNTGSASGTSYVGGVVGHLYNGSVTSCYTVGQVSGSSYIHGLVGYKETAATVTNCYSTDDGKAAYHSTVVSEEELLSGKIAYLLGEAWGQDIKTGEGDTQFDAIPVLGGKTVYKNQLSGCTEESFTYGYANVALDANCTHSQNEAGDRVATCTSYAYCSRCQSEYGNEPIGYHSTNTPNDIAATCTALAYCSVCDSEYGTTIPHSTEGEGDREATCASRAYCSACESEYGTVDIHNHDWDENGFCQRSCALPYMPAELVDGYYQITNGGNLFWFAAEVNANSPSSNAKLIANIDLENRPWTPIGFTGETSNNFRGHFDGQDYTIRGLYVEGGRAGLGFFGEVRLGTVENFTIYGEVKLIGKYDYVGGVIGSAPGVNSDKPEHNGATVRNIISYVNVTLGEGSHGSNRVGGFIGYANHETIIENCVWYGTLDLGAYRAQDGVGGLLGKANDNSAVIIRNCAAYGTIKTAYKSGSYNNFDTIFIGGIVSNSVSSARTVIENTLWAGTIINETDLEAGNTHISAIGTLNGTAENGVVNCYVLNNTLYVTTHNAHNAGITVITAAQLESGEIAYALGWGQNIDGEGDKDTMPLPASSIEVYYTFSSCEDDAPMVYTNNTGLADHVPGADDGDCTTDITCSVCGDVTSEGASTHTGGEATCTKKAKCTVCGKEYGDLVPHVYVEGKCECGEIDPSYTPDINEGSADEAQASASNDNDSSLDEAQTTDSEESQSDTDSTEEPIDENTNESDGLGIGAIVAIAAGSVVVGGAGIFALVWFIIKKKTWADLIAIFKK